MFLLITLLLIFLPRSVSALEVDQQPTVKVTASIGENQVTITGFTSPNSRVELTSPRVFAVTYSDNTGFFIFDRNVLPRDPSDLCLASIDNHHRQSTPTCIPPPPQSNYHTKIGPVLLPPTISLSNDNINPNSTVTTSGQSIPNSKVHISFYKINNKGISFPKEVQAYSLPTVSVESDKEGNFSINIPTAYASNYRLYASTKFKNDYSPKSNTLVYILPSLFYIFLRQNLYLIYFLPFYLITLVGFFTLLYFYIKQKKRFLPAIKTFYPAVKIN